MLTDVQLGAEVKGSDNTHLGKVKLVVANPATNQVTHLVIEKGVLGAKQVVADCNLVRQVSEDGKTVWLTLNQGEFEQLPPFMEREYIGTASPTRPASTINPGIGFSAPAPGGYFDPVTEANSAGPNFVEHLNVPESSLLIKAGAEVDALDGKLGKVKKVNLDPASGKIMSFVVEHGLLTHQDYTVPVDMVDSVTEKGIMLKASKDMFLNPSYDRQDSSGDTP
jgi:uncharacterized protein YrrD